MGKRQERTVEVKEKKKEEGKKSRKKIVERNEERKYKDDNIVSFNTTHPDLEKNAIIFSMHTQKHTYIYNTHTHNCKTPNRPVFDTNLESYSIFFTSFVANSLFILFCFLSLNLNHP